MVKTLEDYSPEELQELGAKAIAAKQKEREKADILKKLWAMYKDGKIKI